MRDNHITPLLRSRQGLEASTSFARLWANTNLAHEILLVWLQMLTAVFRKPKWGIRPIGLLVCD